MLAYAADTCPAGRAGSPKALVLILAGHAALLAAVLTARMDVVGPVIDEIPNIINVAPETPPPPPPPPQPRVERQPHQPVTQDSFIDRERPIIDMEQPTAIHLDTGPSIADIGAVIGSGPTTVIDPPRPTFVKIGPRFATNENAIKPPYPLDKRREGEEATLKLRLTIDTRGRVTAVDPVGAADPSFLEAARRHILRSWRYKPATEDGIAVPSSTVINLSFQLEDV